MTKIIFLKLMPLFNVCKSFILCIPIVNKKCFVCPLCAACVGFHLFISIASVIDAVLGLLCTLTEGLHLQLIFLVAIHIGYLAKYLASNPRK